MLAYIQSNLSTILISGILLVIVICIVKRMLNNRKKGTTSCGCGCSNCAAQGACHDKTN